jgi:hypothetical protein
MLREWIERTPSLGRRLIAERETGAIVADGGYQPDGALEHQAGREQALDHRVVEVAGDVDR